MFCQFLIVHAGKACQLKGMFCKTQQAILNYGPATASGAGYVAGTGVWLLQLDVDNFPDLFHAFPQS